jgi:hypothetical protein
VSSPTPAAVAQIAAKVATLAGGWAGNTNDQIAAALNAPTIANPQAQGTVPKPFVIADLINAAAQATRPNLAPFMAGAAPLVIAQDVPHLAAAIDGLVAVGVVSAADATAMKSAMTGTQPDPSYQAQIGWAQANIGRPVDPLDIAAARPGS